MLRQLRTAAAQQKGTPPAHLEQLARFTWKRALALLGAFAVIHLVLRQIANAGGAVRALRTADWWWVLAAFPALFAAQGFSTLLQQGTISGQLPFGPTYLVQLGGSFLNRVTPNNVGGMALNFPYLTQTGVESAAATGAVGLQAIAGGVAHLVLVAVFFTLTGRSTAVHVSVHSRHLLLLVITVVMALGVVLVLTPWGRQLMHDKVWSFLRSAGTTTVDVARSPQHVSLVVIGAFGGPLVQIVALSLCIHSVGGHLLSPRSAPSTLAAACWRAPPRCRALRPGRSRGGGGVGRIDLPAPDVLVDDTGGLGRPQSRPGPRLCLNDRGASRRAAPGS
jgi:hypothetical protein